MELETPFLKGRRVFLRSLELADSQGAYALWFNDAAVCQGNSHHVFPFTQEEAAIYIEESRLRRDALILAIVSNEERKHLGNIALQSIDFIARMAEFSIVVGENTAWGQGYGREAAHLLFAHGFDALNLHRIGCGTFASNQAMCALALSLGMKEEGRRRQAAFKNGVYQDIIEFGILSCEFDRVAIKADINGEKNE